MSTTPIYATETPAQAREAEFSMAIRASTAINGVQVGADVESIRYTSGCAERALQIMNRLSESKSSE